MSKSIAVGQENYILTTCHFKTCNSGRFYLYQQQLLFRTIRILYSVCNFLCKNNTFRSAHFKEAVLKNHQTFVM